MYNDFDIAINKGHPVLEIKNKPLYIVFINISQVFLFTIDA